MISFGGSRRRRKEKAVIGRTSVDGSRQISTRYAIFLFPFTVLWLQSYLVLCSGVAMFWFSKIPDGLDDFVEAGEGGEKALNGATFVDASRQLSTRYAFFWLYFTVFVVVLSCAVLWHSDVPGAAKIYG